METSTKSRLDKATAGFGLFGFVLGLLTSVSKSAIIAAALPLVLSSAAVAAAATYRYVDASQHTARAKADGETLLAVCVGLLLGLVVGYLLAAGLGVQLPHTATTGA